MFGLLNSIDLERLNSVAKTVAGHVDVVHRFAIPIMYLEGRPITWRSWIEPKLVDIQMESQQRFDDEPIHPTGRARVPSPPSASNMGCDSIYVCSDNVGFYPVLANLSWRCAVRDRIDQRKQLPARSVSPISANAIAVQIAPCVYCPPFSRTPGTYPLI